MQQAARQFGSAGGSIINISSVASTSTLAVAFLTSADSAWIKGKVIRAFASR